MEDSITQCARAFIAGWMWRNCEATRQVATESLDHLLRKLYHDGIEDERRNEALNGLIKRAKAITDNGGKIEGQENLNRDERRALILGERRRADGQGE